MSAPGIFTILKKYWGYEQFRPLQEEIIRSVLDGRDTLALMPTGGGKSLCFQVPALLMDGLCLVISPLISLMKDQVENLQKLNIPAVYVVSGMKKKEIKLALEGCINGQYKFLYLSPERLLSAQFQEYIQHMKLSLLVVDEAHCISQWGYDFRPPYLHIAELREKYVQNVPLIALTATATETVKTDIQAKLNFAKPNVFQKSFERKNLSYVVRYDENKLRKMLEVIRNVGGSGIVYVRSRRECAELTRYLASENVSAGFYHAGMSAEDRSSRQEAWKKGDVQVMVATNAFGMGIDKPDVRFVIHKDLPESPEAYYQEAGRAGRDGKKAFAALLYTKSDKIYALKKLEDSFPSVQEIKIVYQKLGDFYKLAYGAGEGLTVDFELSGFCQQNELKPVKTLQALKFLERDEYISLTDSVFLPSRFCFIISQEDLYEYQIRYARLDTFIKTLLRSYGGAFQGFVRIKEAEIARRMQVSYTEVIDTMKTLERDGVIHYLPQTEQPQLTFLAPRLSSDILIIDRNYIEERKNTTKEKLQAIIDYADKNLCRSQQLLTYFGEIHAPKCGVCDVCIDEKRQNRFANIEDAITNEIIQVLSAQNLSLDELIKQVNGQEKEKLDIIRKLLDAGKMKTDGEQYYL